MELMKVTIYDSGYRVMPASKSPEHETEFKSQGFSWDEEFQSWWLSRGTGASLIDRDEADRRLQAIGNQIGQKISAW